MGGKSGNTPLQTQTAEAVPSGIPSGPVQMQAFPAFSPGQQGLLAQQMQQGFGGTPEDYVNAMSFYRDTTVPVINRPSDIEAYIAQLKASGQLAAPPSAAPAGPAMTGGEPRGILGHGWAAVGGQDNNLGFQAENQYGGYNR